MTRDEWRNVLAKKFGYIRLQSETSRILFLPKGCSQHAISPGTNSSYDTHLTHLCLLSFEKLLHDVKILQVEKTEYHAEAKSKDAKDDAKDGKNMNEA